MEINEQKGEEGYVRERIVPRKRYKHVVGLVLAIFFSLVIFGAAIGISFYLGQRYLNGETTPQIETIVIARDEVTEAPTAPIIETEAETAVETLETEEETEAEEEKIITIRDIYEQVEKSLVQVTYRKVKENDLFGNVVMNESTRFGVVCAYSSANYFVLTDLSVADLEDVDIFVNGVPALVQQTDTVMNMLVLKVSRSLIDLEPASLGNSFVLQPADRVFMFGAPYNKVMSMSEGVITLFELRKDVLDGYEQNLYTDMYKEKGGQAALFNEKGEMIGWISNYSSDEADIIAVANGISGLKYLIEDMCSGKNTAYLGVQGTGVKERDAEAQGIPAGYYVQQVVDESPAFNAGIQIGDCLQMVNGSVITDSRGLQILLDSLNEGQEVTIEILRYGAEGYMPLTLTAILGGR